MNDNKCFECRRKDGHKLGCGQRRDSGLRIPALLALKEGVRQSAAGKIVDLGDFTQYADTTGLEAYSTEALAMRFDILHAHDDRLANDRGYMLDVINGFESDPRDGFDLDDPWNNWAAIDRELGNR